MTRYTLEEARHIVINCSKIYHNKLENKEFIIVYRDREDNNIKDIEMTFFAKNYQHLTGMNLVDISGTVLNHRSEDFYRKCLENRIGLSELAFRRDGMSHLKLQALPSIMKFSRITKIAGDSNGNQPYLLVDKLVGGVNFCLGLRKDSKNNIYVPVSALQRNIKELVDKPSQVLFIMQKERGDASKYKIIKHVSKGLNIHNLAIPDSIMAKISLEENNKK